MSEDVDKLSQVILAVVLKVRAVLICCSAAVLLTGKQVKRVFRSEKRVVIQDFHRWHPVGAKVVCNLRKRQTDRQTDRQKHTHTHSKTETEKDRERGKYHNIYENLWRWGWGASSGGSGVFHLGITNFWAWFYEHNFPEFNRQLAQVFIPHLEFLPSACRPRESWNASNPQPVKR